MKLEMKFSEVVLLGIVILTSITANLPDSFVAEYLNKDILLSVLAGVIIIALFRYLRWMLFLIVTILALGANLPEQLATIVHVDPIVMIATLVLLVLISLLNHIFILLPTDEEKTKTDSGQSRKAVLEAIKSGNVKKLKRLLDMNVDVNFIQDGTSPSHLITEQGNNEMLKLLIESGANMSLINHDGLTPIEVAQALGLNKTVEIINMTKAIPKAA